MLPAGPMLPRHVVRAPGRGLEPLQRGPKPRVLPLDDPGKQNREDCPTPRSSAYVYGSWAARYHGEPGDVPRDIDILVVGEADEDDLDDVTRIAQQRLGREVNIRRVPASAWAERSADPFLQAVRSRPLVPLDLTPVQR